MISEVDASPDVAKLYADFREAFGRPRVPGILTCFATHPPLLKHMLGLAQAFLFTEGSPRPGEQGNACHLRFGVEPVRILRGQSWPFAQDKRRL